MLSPFRRSSGGAGSARQALLTLGLAALLSPAALAQCPIAANCTPGGATDPDAPLFGRGITRVQLNTLDRLTGINDGYQDYSCVAGGSTTLLVGVPYTLTVTTAPGAAEIVRAWADFDNNGIFNPATEQVLAVTATGPHAATFTVPATAVLNQPLRLRIAADDAFSPIPTPCSSPQYSQTEDYTFTVQANTAPPTADFTAGADTLTCSGLVRFSDRSSGAPVTWAWDFGDGSSGSTLQNPQHQYATPGRYTVRLIVTNANGTDTLTRTNYINYDAQVPVVAACSPQTTAYCCGYGIGRVRLAGLDWTSGDGAEGYRDFTCNARAAVVAGNTYTLNISLTGALTHDVRAWLDANNDGQFTASELVLTVLAQDSAVSGTITVPASVPLNTPMRLRIIADAAGQAGGPCVAPRLGQAEDYTVVVRPNTLPPVAAFSVAAANPCDSTRIFTDRSQNQPASWLWYFGDGTTSTQQNPSHTYTTGGSYTVSLVVTNAFGRDSVAVANAAFVTLPCRTYCIPTNLQTQSIWINRVQFADIDRASVLDAGAYVATYSPPARLTQSQTATLTVSTTINQGGGGPPVFTTSAWIDWDQNGVWDASERVMQAQGDPQNDVLSQSFVVPATAAGGPTMMRVHTTRNQQLANNPCPPNGAPGIEVEDYLVIVSGQQAPPDAAFILDNTVSCNGLVQFTDRSTNSPTTWRWDFGDGISSPLQNPQHQYATTPGTYTVKLVATNQYGRDSVTLVNAVQVTGDPAPVAPTCRPESTSPGFGMGIDSVRVTAQNGVTLVNSSPNDTDGYRDYSCQKRGEIVESRPATLRVRTIQAMGTRVMAWIDYNNDGDFGFNSERVLLSANTADGVHTVTFTVPGTAVLNTPLRLRVGSDWANNPVFRPCGGTGPGGVTLPQYGQMEDYTITIRPFVGVAEARAPLALAVVPNPTPDGRVTVQLIGTAAADGTPLTLTVRSVLGQVVARRTLTVQAGAAPTVDLSELARGVYIVQTDSPAAALRGTLRLVRD